jgi:tetratricopeptide (TPR) repeat protein
VILGELLRARDLLVRATELDPESAELAYRHARVLEDLTEYEGAMPEYCRAMSLGEGDAGIADARARIEAIYEVVRERIPPAARDAFIDGITLADAGLYPQSVESFSAAIREVPDWGVAVYNRAVVLEAMGRLGESLADYRRYLEVTPSVVEPVVARVTERIGLLEGLLNVPTPSPGGALALGVVFPGMGHYYSGRGLSGTVVLAAAAAAVVAGIVFKEVTVRCLNPVPSSGECPPGEVVDESTERPYLIPALGAAGAVTLVGAIEAFVRARARRAEASEAAASPEASAFRIAGPTVTARRGRLELRLVGMRFR